MVPQGPPAPLSGAQSVAHSILRSNSGMLGGQGGGMPSQNAFPSLVSSRGQFGGMNMLGNVSNVSSLLQQSFGNGLPGSSHGSSQLGFIDGGVESGPVSSIGNVMRFNIPSSSHISSPIAACSNSSGQVLGQQQLSNPFDQQQVQQLDQQNSQHNQQQMQPFSVPNRTLQQNQQEQQFQSTRPALGGVGPVKLEPQSMNDQASQHLQALRNLGPVKLEPQHLQGLRSLGPVKMEPRHSDPSLFLQQQQQQLLMSRQSSQAVAAAAQMFHQQRLMQMQQQQQQQQQFLKAMPHQRSPVQQQFPPQNLPLRSPCKSVYEPGTCARRLTQYMYQQRHRPEDNNIEFWRKFVAEYFAPNAKKKWCVSLYGSGRQTNGVFPQDVWHCEICNRKPGRGFEATYEVLSRLFKIKYESGTVEELLYVDMPQESQNPAGQIILHYKKAIQESVFEQLRVVRDGQLRIVFSPDLKICSWEFCALRHEELIPRRLLIPQVGQLGAAAQKYQAATQNASTGPSVSDLQNSCTMFVASARQLAKALEVPLVNDLGYTKRYVRCLQISEVVNSMKDLIDYSRATGAGPMESLTKFPRRTNSPSTFQAPRISEGPSHQQEQHQTGLQISNGDNPVPAPTMQLPSTIGTQGVNNSLNPASSSSFSNAAGVFHQSSMNSRPMSGANGSYGGNGFHMPSPGSSSNLPQGQLSVSPFQSPTPSSSNNPQPTTYGSLSGANANSASLPNVSIQQPALSGDADLNDAQSSVQKIIHDLMMSSQFNGSGMMMRGDVKNGNGILSSSVNPVMSSGNVLPGTGVSNGTAGFGNMGNGLGHTAMANGIRSMLGNNPMSMRGGVGMGMSREQSINSQQQDMSNQLQLFSALGAVNGFNDLHFDWKASP